MFKFKKSLKLTIFVTALAVTSALAEQVIKKMKKDLETKKEEV